MGNVLSWVLGSVGYSSCASSPPSPASSALLLAENELLARLMAPQTRDHPRHYDTAPPDHCAIALLPMEALIHVMEFVDEEVLSQACPLVSRAWHEASLDPTLWRSRFEKDFGDDELADGRLLHKEDARRERTLSGKGWRRLYYKQAQQSLDSVGLQGYTSLQTGIRVRIRGRLYDLTTYLYQHPGGSKLLLDFAGKDATDAFNDVHSMEAEKMMAMYEIPPYDILNAPPVVRRLYCVQAMQKSKPPDS